MSPRPVSLESFHRQVSVIWKGSHKDLVLLFGFAFRYEMQEAGVALDSTMKNVSMVHYSA